jgi:hypothetical protein
MTSVGLVESENQAADPIATVCRLPAPIIDWN